MNVNEKLSGEGMIYFFLASVPSEVAGAIANGACGGVAFDIESSPINPVIVPVPPVDMRRVPPLSWLCMMRYVPHKMEASPSALIQKTTQRV